MFKVNSEKLILARAQAAMTIRELSKESSVAASTISKIEKGKTEPNPVTIGRIAKALKTPVIDLIFLQEI
jgi:transcriptional regulator with XRE-family HTH domain